MNENKRNGNMGSQSQKGTTEQGQRGQQGKSAGQSGQAGHQSGQTGRGESSRGNQGYQESERGSERSRGKSASETDSDYQE